jgi:hypothetical protein
MEIEDNTNRFQSPQISLFTPFPHTLRALQNCPKSEASDPDTKWESGTQQLQTEKLPSYRHPLFAKSLLLMIPPTHSLFASPNGTGFPKFPSTFYW